MLHFAGSSLFNLEPHGRNLTVNFVIPTRMREHLKFN